ncbi:phosphopyruvate hydratase [Candidatus Dojkabacteria bacterium]|nr:phosphopyruvate hydratase [Candidatus Dojkabacteria bacterium]
MAPVTIKDIIPRQIIDSRGNPTVEVDLILTDGSFHRASVPSGASTGTHEVVELRDTNDPKRYHGKGVLQACVNAEVLIGPQIMGLDPRLQKQIDESIRASDGTENFSNIGANAALAVSIAVLKAGAYLENVPLYRYIMKILKDEYGLAYPPNLIFPTPMFNVFNGGAHADNNIAIQEFMIIPSGIPDIREKIRAGAEIFQTLLKLLSNQKIDTDVGNEGGFAPDLPSDVEAMELLIKAIETSGYTPGDQVNIGLDVAISQYYDVERKWYKLPHQLVNGKVTNVEGTFQDVVAYYTMLLDKYPILILEDGFHEDDWEGFATLKPIMDVKNRYCMGDDLTVTNVDRIQKGIDTNAINSIIIKPNQIGTITGVFEAIKLCKDNDIKIATSHRSGETVDTTISHIAVGGQTTFIKAGAPSRSERAEKYNELLRMITPDMVIKR